MTTFWLIRHAETDAIGRFLAGRMAGVHLNPAGRLQAERLVSRLERTAVDAIYSSPLERALETAEPLARERGLAIQPCEAANELDLGEWTGKSFKELEARAEWHRFNTVRSLTRIPGGELMLDVQARIVSELDCLRHRHPSHNVAVVSHGDVIKGAVAHYAGIPLDLFHRIEISPASVSVIEVDDHGPRILRVNHTGDL
jgi:probable phosphomutase (TIGR03848 family)